MAKEHNSHREREHSIRAITMTIEADSSDGGHDLCKVLGIECSTEGGIDSGDELLVGLFLSEATDESIHKVIRFGIVI